jgi:hypothetical protein
MQKQEESRISDELDKKKISNVSVLEAPTVPGVPFKTNRSLTVLLGLGMGLLLGFGCAIVAEFFRETVHTPRELEALTGVPVVGTLALNSKRPQQLNLKELNPQEETRTPPVELGEDYVVEFMKGRSKAVYTKY